MFRRSIASRVPIQFFNETFFKPKQVIQLTPENYKSKLFSALPSDATFVRRHRAKFYVVHDANVIGIYSPMMCLPIPRQFPPGGLTVAEYSQFLEENDRVFLMVTCKTSVMVALVRKDGSVIPLQGFTGNADDDDVSKNEEDVDNGDPMFSKKKEEGVQPATFIALQDEHTSIDINENSKFWGRFFGYIRNNWEAIDQASTFWLKKGDDKMWMKTCRFQKGETYDDACPLNFSEDPRWIPTTPYMYFPRLYDFKKKVFNARGAIQCMQCGELALT